MDVKCNKCFKTQDQRQTMPHLNGGYTCMKCVGRFFHPCPACRNTYIPNDDNFKHCANCLRIIIGMTLKIVEVNDVRNNFLPRLS